MRLLKINAALMALIFSVLAEALFCLFEYFFGAISTFGSPLNFVGWLFFNFHILPDIYLRHLGSGGGCLICIPAILFQWWIVFFLLILTVRLIARQHEPKILKVIIATLTATLITSLGLLIHSKFWQNSNWKDVTSYLARIQGAETARKDFDAGRLKLFVISGECHEDKYTGTNDGPFEVWAAEYFPELPYQSRYSEEKKVEAYNLRMRSLYKWSLTHTNSPKLSR
jgi:hypothetical protein